MLVWGPKELLKTFFREKNTHFSPSSRQRKEKGYINIWTGYFESRIDIGQHLKKKEGSRGIGQGVGRLPRMRPTGVLAPSTS